jgi:hypothetical protein
LLCFGVWKVANFDLFRPGCAEIGRHEPRRRPLRALHSVEWVRTGMPTAHSNNVSDLPLRPFVRLYSRTFCSAVSLPMITSSIHGVFLSAVCSAQLLDLRATGVTHRAMVLKAAATQAKINFQIRNRACRWHQGWYVEEAGTSVRRRFWAALGQTTLCPLCRWGAKC